MTSAFQPQFTITGRMTSAYMGERNSSFWPMMYHAFAFAISAATRRRSKVFWCIPFGRCHMGSIRSSLAPNRFRILRAFLNSLSGLSSCWLL